jgi:hypothetical protein
MEWVTEASGSEDAETVGDDDAAADGAAVEQPAIARTATIESARDIQASLRGYRPDTI